MAEQTSEEFGPILATLREARDKGTPLSIVVTSYLTGLEAERDRLRAALEEAWYGLSQWEAYGRSHHPPSPQTARKWTWNAKEALKDG